MACHPDNAFEIVDVDEAVLRIVDGEIVDHHGLRDDVGLM